jgi:PAS domain S-box-containing protein
MISELLAGERQHAVYVARCVTAKNELCYLELTMTVQNRAVQNRAVQNRAVQNRAVQNRAVQNTAVQQGQDEQPMIVGLMRDITERKRAEDAVVRSERYMQRVVDNIPSMVACLSRDLRITFANTAYAAHFDKRVDEVIGASIFDLLPPSQHMQARDHLASLSKYTPQYAFEHWSTLFNGERRYQRWTDYVFFDKHGQVSEYQTVGIDFTNHKLAEEALRQSENKFRALVENMSDVIFTVDLDGKFTYISPSWETVLGYSVEDFLGMSGMVLVHPADVDTVTERVVALFSGEHVTESIFYRVEHADGEWHWHAARGTPLFDDESNDDESNDGESNDGESKVIGVVLVVRDVTNIRESQLLLKSSLDQLERTLANNTMLMKEIHHRIKNNLQIVASLLNLQSRRLSDSQAKVALAANRDRVIAMAKIHNMMYEHESFDAITFDLYIQTLLERIQHAYGASHIAFSVTGDSFAVSVEQAIPLGLIVNELLTNAFKYAFPEPQEDAQVTISLEQNETDMTVIVEDNGVGVAADIDPMTADSFGMTIVQSLTMQLEGELTFAKGAEGQGFKVIVSVPISVPVSV